MSVGGAISRADSLLPGVPVEEGQDPRWQAIIAVGEFIEADPQAVWEFIARWGAHPLEDLRDAVATCLLEHLLEHHFATYFPRVEQLALSDALFGDTFERCWQFGQSLEPGNTECFVALGERLAAARRTASVAPP
jgi:hypothetical protein